MNRKLHILFLCGWYPSKVLPINGDFIQRHAEAVALQHNVSVLHIITDNTAKQTNYDVFEKTNVKVYIAYIKPAKNLLQKVWLFYKAYKYLLLKIGTFDLVHLNSLFPFGIFALHQKWLKKKNYIISEHWTGYLSPQSNKIGALEKAISKLISREASFVCPVSNNLAVNMQELGLKGNYYPIPNVVDTKEFYPAKVVNKPFHLLHISNMKDSHKNISGLLNVIAKVQSIIGDFYITFIGDSSKKYIDKSEELKINNIRFIDQIPQSKLNDYFSKASVFTLFSNTENLPCVILESFATGTPVITTNVGGISEYFPNDFGILVEKGNEKEMQNAILKLYHNQFRYAEPKKMHKYTIANFSKLKIGEAFSKLYLKSIK